MVTPAAETLSDASERSSACWLGGEDVAEASDEGTALSLAVVSFCPILGVYAAPEGGKRRRKRPQTRPRVEYQCRERGAPTQAMKTAR